MPAARAATEARARKGGGATRRRDATAEPAGPSPRFRRATPADALELATARHLEGRRVDMGALARELGVGRATLYRWFGSREELLERVLLERTAAFIAAARAEARGSGDQRLIEVLRRIVEASVAAEPVRGFIEREPTIALRILVSEHGEVHRLLVRESMADLAATRTRAQLRALEPRVDATLQLVTALLWVPIAIGDEPPVERIEGLARELLGEHRARSRG